MEEPKELLQGKDPVNAFAALPERVSSLEARHENMRGHYQGHLKICDGFKDEVREMFAGINTRKSKTVNFSEEQMVFIKKTLFPSATADDFKRLMDVCQEYNLDPIKKDIYLIPFKGKMTVVIGRDGYLKIAHADPHFDGIESDVYYEGDILTKRQDTSLLITYGQHHLLGDTSKIIGAFCNVFRKDQSIPTVVYLTLKAVKQNKDVWNTHPAAMVVKTAEVKALRRAFMFGDSDVEEEE